METWQDSHSQRFSAHDSSVRGARGFVGDVLSAAALELDDAVLLTSELVSNAVDYARTEIDVVVRVNARTVRIEVHDGFSLTEAFRVLVETEREMVEHSEPHGRGLILIRSVAVRMGVIDKGRNGKAVWFELDNPIAVRCVFWFSALTDHEQDTVQKVFGLIPDWMVASLRRAGIPVVPVDVEDGHPASGYLMPAALMLFLADLPQG